MIDGTIDEGRGYIYGSEGRMEGRKEGRNESELRRRSGYSH